MGVVGTCEGMTASVEIGPHIDLVVPALDQIRIELRSWRRVASNGSVFGDRHWYWHARSDAGRLVTSDGPYATYAACVEAAGYWVEDQPATRESGRVQYFIDRPKLVDRRVEPWAYPEPHR